MCRRVTCNRCGKPSFAGCGLHVEQVLADVPRDQRCHCHDAPAKRGQEASKASDPAAPRKSWLWPF